jgi:hypothetical protein
MIKLFSLVTRKRESSRAVVRAGIVWICWADLVVGACGRCGERKTHGGKRGSLRRSAVYRLCIFYISKPFYDIV